MRTRTKIFIGILAFVFFIIIGAGFFLYKIVLSDNIKLPDNKQPGYLFIPTGATYADMLDSIESTGYIKNIQFFRWMALHKKLDAHVHPGRYEILDGMSNNDLINMLKSGRQKPLNVTFNNITFPPQLAGSISKQIEADSIAIIRLFNNEKYLASYGLTKETAPIIFIPNTYEFYWNTTADGFFKRMKEEYDKFWTNERKLRAELLNLSPLEITIIASIVEKETNKNDEKERIAGVYLNRLKRGWKLQADPTTVYAVYRETGNILNRVLWVHTQLDNPYNTYVYSGLPPGPICFPSISSIDATLKPEKHQYMFFVASSDFSGYHRFSTNYNQHQRYVREYQLALRQQLQ
ncbi:MAG: endolytic transglycosylase MltG [Bacteroidales bacterium]